jgi:hypothetical protein
VLETLQVINQLKRIRLIKDYCVVGGYALAYYTEPFYTYDLDIFVLVEDMEEFHRLHKFSIVKGYTVNRKGHFMIGGFPVHFLLSLAHPLMAEAIKEAKRIRIKNTRTKMITIEYLMATLLLSFRAKDKIAILELLQYADHGKLDNILRKFSDEKNLLFERLGQILGSL